MKDSQDAYGHQMYDYFRGKAVAEIVERDDGYLDVSTGSKYYLLVSKGEMRGLLEGTGWKIKRVIESKRPVYIAIIEKEKD